VRKSNRHQRIKRNRSTLLSGDVTKALRAIKITPEDDGVLKGPGGREVTLREVCLSALVSGGPRCPRCGSFQFAADTQDGDVKFKRWLLAQRFAHVKKYIELSGKEVASLKKSVADNQSVMVSGQVWEILDPIEAKQQKESEAKKRKSAEETDGDA